MAEIGLGIGTSHSPMLMQPAELWANHALNDQRNKELCFAPSGEILSFEEALERAHPGIADLCNYDIHKKQKENTDAAILKLAETYKNYKPDIAVMVGDDQDEMMFEDNMPAFLVYWGDTIKYYPRKPNPDASEAAKASAAGYPQTELEIPVQTDLARHIIEYMIDHEFDVSHSKYLRENPGGTVGHRYPSANGEIETTRVTAPRPFGLPHAWSFVVKRVMEENLIPIVPIWQNTCYPPNQPSSKRCFNFGQALRGAIESWGGGVGTKIAVMTSGGLSHFTVDEELDRTALKGMVDNDAEILTSLPRHRLHSAASETLNWVTISGALEHLKAEKIGYEPVYRTNAGSGGGWGMVQWT